VTGDGTATLRFVPGEPAAEGHFPGNPIIPGAVLLREILAALNASANCDIRSMKFHHPVRPGDSLVMTWTWTAPGEARISCSIAGSDRPAVTGHLRFPPP